MKTSKQKPGISGVLRYAYVSTQLMAFLGIGVFGGLKLDEWWGTKPLMIIALPTIALVFSMFTLYRQLMKNK